MDVLDVLLLMAGFEASVATVCPVGWHRYGKACYFVVNEIRGWHIAKSICAASQASLAVPNSLEEQTFIWELLQWEFYPDGPGNGAWIGCNDIDWEGDWQNCPLRGDDTNAYQNWREGKPDNQRGGADCALMVNSAGGKWGNQLCTNPRYATCELAIIDYDPLFCLQIGTHGHIISPCLTDNHVLMEFDQGLESCGMACLSHPKCSSFNLKDQGQGKTVCQLNDLTLQNAADEDVVEIENCYGLDL
ncbi:C-type lectin domain family 10 member A-like [Patiria miniata]|uniref:C-type lectin domain-containing protein n=1 Tax=Patiria miniata TaxID=46514 RepID=A0A913ZE71_PATMI|nr:C-type lectin domain family 10 member A-like [Patiria miniata]